MGKREYPWDVEVDVIFLGLDPGASGGMAALLPDEPTARGSTLGSVRFTSMPDTEQGVWEWVQSYKVLPSQWTDPVHAIIEQVQGYIGKEQPGSAAFKFGQSYGSLRMALTAAGIPFDAATPQVWQRALDISPRKKSEDRTAWKNRLKLIAELWYPRLVVTLATADALLIARYCRIVHESKER